MLKTGTPPIERKVFRTTCSGLAYRTSAQKIHGQQTSRRQMAVTALQVALHT